MLSGLCANEIQAWAPSVLLPGTQCAWWGSHSSHAFNAGKFHAAGEQAESYMLWPVPKSEPLPTDGCWALCYESYDLHSVAVLHYIKNTTGRPWWQDKALSASGKENEPTYSQEHDRRAVPWLDFSTRGLLQSPETLIESQKYYGVGRDL